jgi:hypothetical protein
MPPSPPPATKPPHAFRLRAVGVALVPAAILLAVQVVRGIAPFVAKPGEPVLPIAGAMAWAVPLALLGGFGVSASAILRAARPRTGKGALLIATLVVQAFAAMLALAPIFGGVR